MMHSIKLLYVLIICLFLVSCGGGKAGTESDGNSKNNVTLAEATVSAKSGLTLRATPKKDGKQVTLIPTSEKVSIIDKNGPQETIEGKSGNWYKVKYKDQEGYVFSAYLALSGENSGSGNIQEGEQKSTEKGIDLTKFTRPTSDKEAIVAAPSGIKLRSKPSTVSEEVIVAPYDAKLEVLAAAGTRLECIGGVLGRWKKVKYKDKEGYVSDAFLRVTGGSPDPMMRDVTTESGVILRDKPSKEGKKVSVAPQNARVEIVNNCSMLKQSTAVTIEGTSGYWVKIKYKGKEGYVFSGFLMGILG